MLITKCPKCKEKNIMVSFNHKFRRYTLECHNCNKAYALPHYIIVLCPDCDGKKFAHEKYESYCLDCGLVMSSTIAYVAGFKIDYPWGMRV